MRCVALAILPLALALHEGGVHFPDPADFSFTPQPTQAPAFSLSSTLGSSMVLQRAPASAVLWGFATPGAVITTRFDSVNYTSVAGGDTVWRVHLRPTPAGGPYSIQFSVSTGESAALTDVLFGDVYMCGGQSNMQFAIGGNENAAAYAKQADSYPNIRLFTVGQKTSSATPLDNLQTVEQPWVRASASSVTDGAAFSYFSAVCWFFGKSVYDGLNATVPIGLISDNWGGTRVEQWMPATASLPCGHASTGELYNAMIVPYSVGPMALTGFTWYQGESDLAGNPALPDQNNNYTCTQTALIQHWRTLFHSRTAFFGIVQLSTWLPDPNLLAELREQQLGSEALIPNFAWATNADYGAGANIHPPYKQHVGARLANAALAMVYGQAHSWRSPRYVAASGWGQAALGQLTVWLSDVGAGLVMRTPSNQATAGNCTALNAKRPQSCAWAELRFNDPGQSWVNASVAISDDGMSMVLSASPPAGATAVTGSSYGWGAIPMLSVYRADVLGDASLPVLPWKKML